MKIPSSVTSTTDLNFNTAEDFALGLEMANNFLAFLAAERDRSGKTDEQILANHAHKRDDAQERINRFLALTSS